MIRTIVPDNMKAIVKTPDALSPVLVAAFLDYVQARGIFVDPARIRSPQDKPRVENQVPYVRESWFDGETFTGLGDARQSAETWCRDVAGARVHGTTRQVPRELFESTEKPAMLAPPAGPFDVPLWIDEAKVHPDHHIQVARALYSVPSISTATRWCAPPRRQDERSRSTPRTDLIKMHPRQRPGGRSTDPGDYPSGKADYALRSVDALTAGARLATRVPTSASTPSGCSADRCRGRVCAPRMRSCAFATSTAMAASKPSARALGRWRSTSSTSRASRACSRPPPPSPPRPRAATASSCSFRCRDSPDPAHFETRAREQEGGRLMASPRSTRSFVTALKRLKLGRILDTLPERLVLADKQEMSLDDLLLLVLTDEIARRDSTAADNRARDAGLDPAMRLEQWDKSSKVTFDKRMLAELVSLRFLEAHRHVVVLGPVGVGKTFVSQALGHIACRHGYNVRFVRADAMLRTLRQSRLDNSRDAEMISLTSVDLLIVDDFALEPMSKEESRDVYQLFLERTGHASMIVTSNRDTAEWLAMFDDVLLAQSAVDRFKNAAYDFVIEGESYRPRLKPTLDAADPPPPRHRQQDPPASALTTALTLGAVLAPVASPNGGDRGPRRRRGAVKNRSTP